MAFQPYMMKNVDLVIGEEGTTGTNFKCQIRAVKLTPEVSVQRIKTACPTGQYSDVDDPEWSCELGYVYGSDNGTGTAVEILADFLLENVGETVPVTFRPVSGGPGYKVMVKLIPGAIGGEHGSFSEQTVTLPVDGQPEKLAAL